MALTDSEKRALVALLRADIKDELKAELAQQRTDEQATMPHTGNAGASGDPGEETNKLLTGIADKLSSMSARMDELEKGEDLKSEGLKGTWDEDKEAKVKELKECSDATGEDAGEIPSMGEPKPLRADADFYADMRKQPDHVIESKSNYPPAEPGALFSVSRSKRLEGDADASPAHCAT